MHSKTLFTLTLVVISLYASHALPRDISVVKQETIPDVNHAETKDQKSPFDVTGEKDHNRPGRVFCQYEEATEDIICQEHCVPKGYSYGICVSNTCSCV